MKRKNTTSKKVQVGIKAIQFVYFSVEVPADAGHTEVSDAVDEWYCNRAEFDESHIEICGTEPLKEGDEVEATFVRDKDGNLVLA